MENSTRSHFSHKVLCQFYRACSSILGALGGLRRTNQLYSVAQLDVVLQAGRGKLLGNLLELDTGYVTRNLIGNPYELEADHIERHNASFLLLPSMPFPCGWLIG